MKFSEHFDTLSHSYLIEGDHDLVEKELILILENAHGIRPIGNSDFYMRRFGTFTIEDAREIKEMASRRKTGEGLRAFIVSASGLTREASNALLKTLEEPQEGTHFFIILPSVRRVLPTIVSRSRVVLSGFGASASEKLMSPEAFLKASPAKRVSHIKDFMAKLDKEDVSKADMQAFIAELVEYQHSSILANRKEGEKEKLQKLGVAAHISSYSLDQSASLKMVLEYLALNL